MQSRAHVAVTSPQAATLPEHGGITSGSAIPLAQDGSCKIPGELDKTSTIPLVCSRTNATRLTYATGAFPGLHLALFMVLCWKGSLGWPKYHRDITVDPVAVSRATPCAQSEGG